MGWITMRNDSGCTNPPRKLNLKAWVSNLENPARVNQILKVFNRKYPNPPFRPPSKVNPPKHFTSFLALATCLPSLVEDSGHAQRVYRGCTGSHQAGRQTGRPSNDFHKLLDGLITGMRQLQILDLFCFFRRAFDLLMAVGM